MSIDIQRFSDSIRGTKADRTATTYRHIVERFLSFLGDDDQPSCHDVEAFIGRLSKTGSKRAPTTRNQELAALRCLANFACREHVWFEDATADIAFVRVPQHDAPFFTMDELARLFLAAADEASSILRSRNIALLAVLSQAGLRVHEAVGLNVDQVDIQQEVLVGVCGKGDTCASIPISPEVALVFARWLESRRAVAEFSEKALFVSSRGRRLSIRAVERLVQRLREKVGIAKAASCHALRHSTATLSLELGTDLATIAELLRHRSIATTQRYLHNLDGRRRDAVRRLARTMPKSVLVDPARPTMEPNEPEFGYPKKVVDDQYVLNDAA